MTHTAASLTTLIQREIEPPNAEALLASLRQHDGQLINSRLLDRLPGSRIEWRLTRQLGQIELRNRAYATSHGTAVDGLCLTLARSETSVPLVSSWVEANNPAYFSGRRNRNMLRAQALLDVALLTQAAEIMNEIEATLARLSVARKRFDTITAFGTPLYPDHYELQRACGLRGDK